MDVQTTTTILRDRNGASVRVYDPCGAVLADKQPLARRVASLDGLRIAALDNTKWNAMTLLRNTVEMLQKQVRFVEVHYYRKEAFSVPSPRELLEEIAANNDIAITAIGDCGSCTSCCTVDSIALETLGIPTALIVTTEFVHESRMQQMALGMDDLKPIVIHHPLSALTDDLILQRAQQAADQAPAIWCGAA